jgi:hypothetical protein
MFTKWLKADPPGHFLRVSLLANGYGHILDRPTGHGNNPTKRALRCFLDPAAR